jgi:CheY-like chemotaxis protein
METLARDSLRIVHVDDDPDFVELSGRYLKRAGFEQPITRCPDGALAIDYFSALDEKVAPHAILLDLHMPKKNGLDVLHWVRHLYRDRDVAVYLLTSCSEPEAMRRAEADRVTKILLKKPFFEELIECLDYLITVKNAPASIEADCIPSIAFRRTNRAKPSA